MLAMVNNSSTDYIDTIRRRPLPSDTEKILFTTGLMVLSILSIFGNSLVIVAFSKHRPLRKVTNYFIVSLSISDILVALFSMPVWITVILMDMNFNLLGGKLIKIWTCVDISTGIASILNLTAVSFDRLLHIVKPYSYRKIATKKRVLCTAISIWIFSIGISLIKGIHWSWRKPNYEITAFVIGFALPLLVILGSYFRIYRAVVDQLARCKENTISQSSIKEKRKKIKAEVKAIKSIALVVLAFFICWCPFFTLNLYHGICRCILNQHLITLSKWLHYLNSVVNPIIYACFNKDYRKGFQKALVKQYNKHPDSTISQLIRRTSFGRLSDKPMQCKYKRSTELQIGTV